MEACMASVTLCPANHKAIILRLLWVTTWLALVTSDASLAAPLFIKEDLESSSLEHHPAARRLSQHLRGSTLSSLPSTRDGPLTNSTFAWPTATASFPLHSGSGTHHVHIYIGSPPQRQTLIVDTGSRLMAFPCAPCAACGKHASPHYFDPSISTTDVTPTCGQCHLAEISTCSEFSDKCVLHQKYTEGSGWHAYEVEDVVWFGTARVSESMTGRSTSLAVPYTFGCQTSETGLFRKQYADGILGLALHETSIIHVLYQGNIIPQYSFSLCFTKRGGQFSLGGTLSPQKHLEEMQFVPLYKQSGFYSLQVVEVLLDDMCLTCELPRILQEGFWQGKGAILDSGTTDTYLPKAISSVFSHAWEQLTGFRYNARRRHYTYPEFSTLPHIHITFQGNTTLTIAPSSYMEGVPFSPHGTSEVWGGSKELTNRIYVNEPVGAVLGANAMQGYDVYFDVAQRRVGLARAECAYDDSDAAQTLALSQ